MSPRPLPLVDVSAPVGAHGRASRHPKTCEYRCGNACDKPIPNQSGNPHMADVITSVVQRRTMLKAGAGAAVTVTLAAALPSTAAAAVSGNAARAGALQFSAVAPNKRDNISVPRGYRYDIVARWGDRIVPGSPVFNPYKQTPEAQAGQFGYNCDYVGVVPIPGSEDAVLVVNHEYTNPELMFPENYYDDVEKIRIEMMAHGMSVLEIKRGRLDGAWVRKPISRTTHNRRITADTPMVFSGPAAGDPRLRTSDDPSGRRPRGTLNNCAGGTTPWGTILSGEENFNQYFDGAAPARFADSFARYGIGNPEGLPNRGWGAVDARFDLAQRPKEPFRFGYIVEIDPLDPESTPVKHTMLGRFKHEGATVSIAPDGRAVAYSGDDERGDYIYKFVSAKRFRTGKGKAARDHNKTLLETGTLYVARFTGDGDEDGLYDGTGEWIPLCSDTESFVDGWSVADILIETRLAADEVQPTRMDRPEDIERNPVTGRVYAALTNNTLRGSTFAADEANPITTSQVRSALGQPLTDASGNRNGYVLEWTETGNDQTALTFRWNLFLVCGDPAAPETYFGGFPKDQVSPISCPDNVTFDPAGNLYVSTDGNVLGSNDGLFAVPTRGVDRGHVRQFLTVPVGAETCGPLITDDGKSVFVAVQHPGEGGTFDEPTSTWPHTDRFPRPSVACSYRIDNQRIGL